MLLLHAHMYITTNYYYYNSIFVHLLLTLSRSQDDRRRKIEISLYRCIQIVTVYASLVHIIILLHSARHIYTLVCTCLCARLTVKKPTTSKPELITNKKKNLRTFPWSKANPFGYYSSFIHQTTKQPIEKEKFFCSPGITLNTKLLYAQIHWI